MNENILIGIIGIFLIILFNIFKKYKRKYDDYYERDMYSQIRIWGGIAMGIMMTIIGFMKACLGLD